MTAQQIELVTRFAAQVAHDLRSPLAALDSVLNDLSQMTEGAVAEDCRVLTKAAVVRIKDLANHLQRIHQTNSSAEASGRLGPIPSWFLSGLEISKESRVVVVDDDPCIHQLWIQRFGKIEFHNLFHLFGPEELTSYLKHSDGDLANDFYLIDYEFAGSALNGLDLGESQMLPASRTVLTTSQFEEIAVKRRCVALGIRLLPKSSIWLLPITVKGKSDSK